MLRYQPVIVKDEVYYPLSMIAKAYGLDNRFLRILVNKTDEYGLCLPYENNETLIPFSVFQRLALPFDRPTLHFLYGYGRTRYLLNRMRHDTEFDYDFEGDDYYEQ